MVIGNTVKLKKISEEKRCALGLKYWPEAYKGAPLVLSKLVRAAEFLEAVSTPLIAGHKIQPTDFDVLATLRSAGPPFELRPTEIYQSRFCSTGGLTKTLHRLENAKLIERHPDPQDKRSLLVRLTPKGKRIAEITMQGLRDMERKLLAEFGPDELETARATLDKLLDALIEQDDATS